MFSLKEDNSVIVLEYQDICGRALDNTNIQFCIGVSQHALKADGLIHQLQRLSSYFSTSMKVAPPPPGHHYVLCTLLVPLKVVFEKAKKSDLVSLLFSENPGVRRLVKDEFKV